MLINSAYPTEPFTLKSRLVRGESAFEILPVTFRVDNKVVMIKYGKSDGRTHANHKFIPSITAVEKSPANESIIAKAIKMKNIKVSKKEFNVLVILYCIMT